MLHLGISVILFLSKKRHIMRFKNSLSEVDSVALRPSSVAYVLHDNVHSLLLCALCLFLGIMMTFLSY